MMLLRSALGLRLSIGLSVPTLYLSSQILYPRPYSILQCQASPFMNDRIGESRRGGGGSLATAQRYDPESRAVFNPTNFRQISTGSFGGVLAGYMVGKLSRMFAFVAIIFILLVQTIERRGIQVIPYQKLRGIIGDIDPKKALTENWAFRWSFASTFILSAWFAN